MRGIVAWSPELDYAVVRLAEPTGRPGLPFRHDALEAALEDNVAVNVIQHPNGKAKRIGLRNNIVDGTTEREIRYFTDTDSGVVGARPCSPTTGSSVPCTVALGASTSNSKESPVPM